MLKDDKDDQIYEMTPRTAKKTGAQPEEKEAIYAACLKTRDDDLERQARERFYFLSKARIEK